jgi:predicted nucleotidyltransferase
VSYAPLVTVAQRLGPLRERVVFVGGMVRGLLITDTGASPARPTDDVDLIVGVASRVAYIELSKELRALGFREDTELGAPLCRWTVGGIKVDVMPDDGSILGFRNTWYTSALTNPQTVTVGSETLRIVDAPHFCATKLEAFVDRGKGDFYHHDLEDVIAVVDGRAELADELHRSSAAVRAYVSGSIAALLKTRAFMDALPGHLPGDAASQQRLPMLEDRLRRISVGQDNGPRARMANEDAEALQRRKKRARRRR